MSISRRLDELSMWFMCLISYTNLSTNRSREMPYLLDVRRTFCLKVSRVLEFKFIRRLVGGQPLVLFISKCRLKTQTKRVVSFYLCFWGSLFLSNWQNQVFPTHRFCKLSNWRYWKIFITPTLFSQASINKITKLQTIADTTAVF